MKLTAREEEILRALTDGLTYKEIADSLDISMNTARTHLKKIYVKLGVQSRTAAAVKWLNIGDGLQTKRGADRQAR